MSVRVEALADRSIKLFRSKRLGRGETKGESLPVSARVEALADRSIKLFISKRLGRGETRGWAQASAGALRSYPAVAPTNL